MTTVINERLRLGISQRSIAERLPVKASPPIRWGTQGETDKIYERLCELNIAEKIENPALSDRRRSGPIDHVNYYKRGTAWAEAAKKYGWPV